MLTQTANAAGSRRRLSARIAITASFYLSGFVAGPAICQAVDAVDIAPEVVLEDRYPERKVSFSNGVTSLADVVYSTHVGYRPLVLDLYLPPGGGADNKRYPLVVMVHGGAWQSGHTRHSGAFADWPAALASVANDGFVVASVEYRLSKEASFPAAFDDVRTAIRWLRAFATAYGIDKNSVVVMGASAGGQLAGLVGTACGDNANPAPDHDTDEPVASESPCVQGVVAWYGVFDFSPLVAASGDNRPVPEVVGRYLGCEARNCNSNTVRTASAIAWIDSSDPPFLMIHGVADQVVSVEQSRAMKAALEKAGVRSTLIEIPDVQHSFIGKTPAITIDASRQAWDASIAFIRQVLRDKQVASR